MINVIRVTNLFGLYSYTIPLNKEEGLTIIYGMNGSGKTTLLNMIRTAIELDYGILSNYKFDEFNIYFDDMELSFINYKENLNIYFKTSDNQEGSFDYIKKSKRMKSMIEITHENGTIERRIIYPDKSEVHEKIYQRELPFFRVGIKDKDKKLERELNELLNKRIAVHFIETQRLLDLKGSKEGNGTRIIEYVEKYSDDLAERIRNNLTQYSEISQKLDKTFPKRLLKQEQLFSEKDLKNKLVELENKRTNLGKAGILAENDSDEFIIPNNIGEQDLKVLTVYAEDVENKLSVFDSLLNKIENLLRLLKFSNKEIIINKDNGIHFKNDNGDVILPRQLSSGEQHRLVILYRLIFMSNNNALFLIDEPELSLHILWQKAFIDNLKSIMKNNTSQMLIATHSPQIIGNYWDATFSLDEENDKI